jgi:predicted  nucleic acid-binding Zn-ribbon protein
MTIDELARLLAVQDLDLAIDQHRHRRGNLPERSELAAIDTRGTAVTAELKQATERRDEIAARQAHAEGDLAATEARAQAVSRRLYGGEVSASRELKAMAEDVDNLKSRASALEDQVLELLEQREPLDLRATGLQAELLALGHRREQVADQLAVAERALDDETAVLTEQRQAAASDVSAALMSTYERLRSRLGGVGVARLVGNRCDGCHLTLSAVELDRIRRLTPTEVFTCEQCSRILVPQGAPAS